jgi:hypothetical protein
MKPSTYKSILVLFLLSSLLSVKAQDFRFGKVSKEELEEKVHPLDSTANAAILYREVNTKFDYNQDDGFYLVESHFERIKIYNKDGYNWATKTINSYESDGRTKEKIYSLKGETYFLQDGKVESEKLRNNGIFEEEKSKFLSQTKFTMPNIKDGCIIEYKYDIKSPFISSIDSYRFQEKIPINKVKLDFIAPEYFSYKLHQKGAIPFTINTDGVSRDLNIRYRTKPTNGFGKAGRAKTETSQLTFRENIYKVEINDMPALKEEAYAGNLDNYRSSLKFELSYTNYPQSSINYYTTTWEDVSKSIYRSELFGQQLEKNNYYKNDIDALIKGVTDDNEKLILIFEYVKGKMNWNSYLGAVTDEGVRNAYKKNTGNVADINLMLVSMLRYAGLNSNPVLTSTKSNGIPIFPTRSGFNYVVASVENKESVLLLDATNKYGEPNILESEIINWQGRIIRGDESSAWVSLYPSKHAVKSLLLNAKISEDLTIVGDSKVRYDGHYALSSRNKFSKVNNEDVRKEIENQNGNVEIVDHKFENLQKLYEPVNLFYNFETLDLAEEVSGKIYFSPMLFLKMEQNPFKLEERVYPIDFIYPKRDRFLIKLEIPEGYAVESIPEGGSFGLPDNLGSFRYLISSKENIIQLSVDLAINAPVISSQFYSNLKQFFELVVQKENEKVVLTKI